MEKLSSVFFYHLEKAIKTYRQHAQSKLKENGFDITVDQWLVLKALSDNPGFSQVELAEAVFKDKASITRIIDILVSSGCLDRELDDNNRRRYKLTITKKGQKLLKEVMPTVLKYRKTALRNISEEDILIAERVLNTITMNCSKS
jgi:DNA-binding MarR family transcriptional regulator